MVKSQSNIGLYKVTICCALLLSFFAFFSTGIWALGSTASGHTAVNDDAMLFNESERQRLVQEVERMNERWGMDVVIATTNDTNGRSAMAYADDYFDYNGYGTGADRDGVLYLIDMDNRRIWLSTSGDAIRRLTDSRIDTILDKAIIPMHQDNYAGSVFAFLNETDRLIGPRRFQIKHVIVAVLAAGTVFGIWFSSQKSRYKKRSRTWNYDLNDMTVAEFPVFSTVLVDKNVTYVRRPRQSSSGGRGGGSSTHTSSSGRSHGGGGRSF